MPAYKSSLTCLKYMQRIRSEKYWCPKVSEIHPHTCVDAPRKDEVVAFLVAFAQDAGKNLGITAKRQPDKQWALTVLKVLKPDHKYFRKSYVPTRARDKIMVDNADGFLDGLPPGPLKKRFAMVFKEAEEVKLKRQLLRFETQLKKNKRRLRELEQKRDSDDERPPVVVDDQSEDSSSDGEEENEDENHNDFDNDFNR